MDMDFMNLNQTAHGGREYGFIGAGCASSTAWWSATGRTRPRGTMDPWMRVAAARA
jgi:L-arabinose isomerase